MSTRSRRWFLVGFVLHTSLVVTIASLAYSGKVPLMGWAVAPWDLLGHALLIGMLGMLLDGALGFRPLWPSAPRWLGLGPVIIVSIAGFEETMQMFASNRSSTISDFAADVVGIVFFSTIARILARPPGKRPADPDRPS
jgi:hypothetical protein